MKFVFPIPCCVHIWRTVLPNGLNTADDIICLSPNLMCDVLSFRFVSFVCLWMVFVCVAFLVDLSDCLFYCIAWAFCPMPVSCPSVSVFVVAHSISSQFSYIWLSKADVLYSQQWILSLLYRFPSHGGQYIR